MTRPGHLPAELSSRFLEEGLIGVGAMGTVVRATDRRLGRAVAIKVLGERARSPTDLARFVHESRILADLSHAGIVRLFDAGVVAGTPYLVMELIEGRSLDDRLAEGLLGVAQVRSVLSSILDGLEFVHDRGVLHRDIKPSNVFLRDGRTAVLIDFGLARRVDVHRIPLTAPEFLVGTPRYIAPEILSGAEHSMQSDIFAVGMLAFRTLSSEEIHGPPGGGPLTHAQVLSSLASGAYHDQAARVLGPMGALGEVILRALAPAPADRQPGARGMREALTWASHPRRSRAAPRPTVRHTARAARPPPPPTGTEGARWTRVGAGGTVLLALVAIGWLGLARTGSQVTDGRPGPRPGAARARPGSHAAGPRGPARSTASAMGPDTGGPTRRDAALDRRLAEISRRWEVWERAVNVKRTLKGRPSGDPEGGGVQTGFPASLLSTSGLDLWTGGPLPILATPGDRLGQTLYRQLFRRLMVARAAADGGRLEDRVLRLFPRDARPAVGAGAQGRVLGVVARPIPGVAKDTVLHALHRVKAPGGLPARRSVRFRLQGLAGVRHATLRLRSEGAGRSMHVVVELNGRLTVHLLPPAGEVRRLTHSVPPWALVEGENELVLSVDSYTQSGVVLPRLDALEVVLVP